MPTDEKEQEQERTHLPTDLLILGLGGNLGPTEAHLRAAIQALRQLLGRLQIGPLYRSVPVSQIAQPDFLNTVVAVDVVPGDLSPENLLAITQQLEKQAGRQKGERWGPRVLDIDLLLWGDRQYERPRLTLPHPRLRARRFVLAPLVDLLPDLPLPPDARSAREVLRRLEADLPPGAQAVERLSWSRMP